MWGNSSMPFFVAAAYRASRRFLLMGLAPLGFRKLLPAEPRAEG